MPVSPAAASEIAGREYGLAIAAVKELGSNEDRNLLLSLEDGRRVLLKIASGAPTDFAAQDAALDLLAGSGLPFAVPRVWPTLAGARAVAVAGAGACVRVLDFLDGAPPAAAARPAPGLPAALGTTAATLTRALERFDHGLLAEGGDWDLREARRVLDESLAVLAPGEAARLDALLRGAEERLAPWREALRVQAVHGDLTADNVVMGPDGAVAGVIDFGDLGRGWRVGEAAIAACSLLQHDGPAVRDALTCVAAFDAVAPLTREEIAAWWPLVVTRAVVLAAAGKRLLAADPANAYARVRRPLEARMLDRAAALGFDEAELLLLDALGRVQAMPVDGLAPAVSGLEHAPEVDLSVLGDAADGGAWMDQDWARRTLAEAAAAAGGAALSRYGEHRLTPEAATGAAGASMGMAPRSHALAIEAALPPGTPVHAPGAGVVSRVSGGAVVVDLDSGGAVHLRGVDAEASPGDRIAFGDLLGRVGAAGAVSLQLCAVTGVTPPVLVAPGHEEAWGRLCPHPGALVGHPAPASSSHAGTPPAPGDLLAARVRTFPLVQEHYYDAPPRIERGWRHHLLDTDGRGYLDMVNNVAILGHGEPRIAAAVDRQLRRLNTNSRFHYAAVVEFAEALAARAPEGLDQVLLVNSGSEAVDLAIRMARAATERTDIVALTEAYHGWTVGADSISTSLGDNPAALATRPAWVRLLDAPNTYRGRHRGADAPLYLRDALDRLARWDAEGVEIAGVVSEPIFGNGGGVLLPDGYLAGLWDAVRERGGVCVSDEVQVSYGRLGAHFWGFEQQGAVPDIIAVAKAMGNGHPLGAVITTREIAEAFAVEGSFFSSAGGSPVSCVVGSTVLRVLDEDRLQDNARVVGALLGDGLRELCDRFDALGAVHGMGLYLGVEVVRGGPDAPDPRAAREICAALLEEGVIVQPTGDHKNVLKIKPPLTIDAPAVDRFLRALEGVLARREARAELGGDDV